MNDEGSTMPHQRHRHHQDENRPLVLLDTRLDDALIPRAQSKQYSTLPSPFSSGPGAERWRGGRNQRRCHLDQHPAPNPPHALTSPPLAERSSAFLCCPPWHTCIRTTDQAGLYPTQCPTYVRPAPGVIDLRRHAAHTATAVERATTRVHSSVRSCCSVVSPHMTIHARA